MHQIRNNFEKVIFVSIIDKTMGTARKFNAQVYKQNGLTPMNMPMAHIKQLFKYASIINLLITI